MAVVFLLLIILFCIGKDCARGVKNAFLRSSAKDKDENTDTKNEYITENDAIFYDILDDDIED